MRRSSDPQARPSRRVTVQKSVPVGDLRKRKEASADPTAVGRRWGPEVRFAP